VLLDTGVIVAFLDRSERYHRACVQALEEIDAPLATCEAVITESCYLLQRVPGAAERIMANVASGLFQIPFRLVPSAADIVSTIRKYRDRQVNLADACLIHLATELKTGDILTLDRDFQVYRWGPNRPFRNLVSLGPPI
jgi:predicted nucleic acid-binding protein